MSSATGRFLVVGAGFAGSVMARELAERLEADVDVVDGRPHVGGNCHTARDGATGIMVHRYGPHIFHTDSERAWEYVRRFATMRPYVNRVKAVIDRGVFSLPINLHTINQFFGARFTPDEARRFVATLCVRAPGGPRNFEEQALEFVGRDLYQAFFYGYTRKQWGVEPRELPASLFKRLPLRFTYDDNYFSSRWQGIPEQGYTELIGALLAHPRIRVTLGSTVDPVEALRSGHRHLVWTGPIDGFFANSQGALGYRSVRWDEERGEGDLLGNALMNYPDAQVPYTRRIEHKHFAPWERHERTVVSTEFSARTEAGDLPCYPVGLAEDQERFRGYLTRARQQAHVTFAGRLGTYRYMDMDQVILDTLALADEVVAAARAERSLPPFPASLGDRGPA